MGRGADRGLADLDGVDAVIVAANGHTGNFVLRSAGDRTNVRRALATVLEAECAVMTVGELQGLVNQLNVPATLTEKVGVRWTPGAALLVEGQPRAGDLQGTPRAEYHRFGDTVVLVHKRDALTRAGILDRSNRMGGWGAMASEVARQLGGQWTARSCRTLIGTIRRAAGLPSSDV